MGKGLRDYVIGTAIGLSLAGPVLKNIEGLHHAIHSWEEVMAKTEEIVEKKEDVREIARLDVYQRASLNYTKGRRGIEGIVIHSTEGSGKGALDWLIRKESGVSSHYLIMENGEIYQLVKEQDTAWHAGKAANPISLGIEFAGYAHKTGFNFRDEQYNSAGLLINYLLIKHNLKKENVVSHDWVSKNLGGTNHSDPGKNFDWNKLDNALDRYSEVEIEIVSN